MAKNLLNLLQGQLSEGVIGKIANLIGTNAGSAKSAIDSILPNIVNSISETGSAADGAKKLLKLKKDSNLGAKTLGKLDGILGDNNKAGKFKNVGKSISSMLLGDKEDSYLTELSGKSGLTKEQTSDLYKYLAPVAISNVDDAYFSSSSSKATSSSTSTSSKDAVLLEGLTEDESAVMLWIIPLFLIGGYMLFFDWNPQPEAVVKDPLKQEVIEPVKRERYADATPVNRNIKKPRERKMREGVKKLKAERAAQRNNKANQAANTVRKAAPAAGAAAAGAAATTQVKTRNLRISANGDLVDQTGKVIAKAGSYRADAQGNLLNNSGTKLASAGTYAGTLKSSGTNSQTGGFSVDANGNLVDGTGKVVYKKGEFSKKDGYYVDKKGNKIGKFLKDVGAAVSGAAGKTADFFKDTFGGMFKKKEASVGKTYGLSKITFDPNSHRIINFSKNEVEGLAAALKAYPDSKIQVQVHSDKSSKDRAKVVHDMLVTLGVAAKQISFKGMGDKDAAKSAAGKVEIMVEK